MATERTMTGAAVIIRALIDQGVEVVFGYPGGAVLPIYDEIFKTNELRHVLVRHEHPAWFFKMFGGDVLSDAS